MSGNNNCLFWESTERIQYQQKTEIWMLKQVIFTVSSSPCSVRNCVSLPQQCRWQTSWGSGPRQSLAGRSYFLKYCMRFHSTRLKYRLIYAGRNSTAFRGRIFTKLTHMQQQYVRMCYTELHPCQRVNVCSTDKNSFTSLSKVWHCADFIEMGRQCYRYV
jgi:hypothetical protein